MTEESFFEKAKYCLKKAVENDDLRRNEEAVENYIAGIDFLYKHINNLLKDDPNRTPLISMMDKYMARAETLKKNLVVTTKLFKKIQIEEDSKGHSYEAIFSPCLDDLLTEVVIEEPYLIQSYQIANLVMLCELILFKCKNLKKVVIVTGSNGDKKSLDELADSLKESNITMSIKFQEFHDREIKFNNGWLVKMGRGLHFYQPCNRFTIGSFNYNFRRCKRTSIEIYKTYQNL